MNPRTDELAVLAKSCSPMYRHTPAQAAPLLGIDLNVMQSAKPGDDDFVPYIPDQFQPKNRLFLLGDILTAAGMTNEIPGIGDPVTLEEAEAMLETRIGPPPADWFDPVGYDSQETIRRRALWSQDIAAAQQEMPEETKPKRGRRRNDAQAVPGGRFVRPKCFVSTADFLRRARLEDSWVFAKPRGSRPYDFLESVFDADSAPWEIMTLAAYLDAVRSGASDNHASDFALNEADEIASCINPSIR